MADMINNPPHYKDASGVECIEVTRYMQFCGGNCFKYLYRAGQKGSAIEDLEKAAKYAMWAGEQGEIVGTIPMVQIELIARCRTGDIRRAMLYIAQDGWADVARCIKREIKRIKSESAQ